MRSLFELCEKAYPAKRAELLANWGYIRTHGFVRPFLRRNTREVFIIVFVGAVATSLRLKTFGLAEFLDELGWLLVWGAVLLLLFACMEYLDWWRLERDWQAKKRTEAEAGQPQSPP